MLQRLRDRLGYAAGPDHSDAGFTLVEALVSLVIFAIVASAAVLAVVAGISTNNNTNDRIAATHVAQRELDRLTVQPQTSLSPTTTTTSAPVGSKTYSVRREVSFLPAGSTSCPTVAPAATDTSAHEIRVKVVVTVPGSGRTVQMDSVRSC